MRLPSIRPARKRGMGTTAKVLLMTLPVVAYMAGKMMGSRNNEDNSRW